MGRKANVICDDGSWSKSLKNAAYESSGDMIYTYRMLQH
jgi:hypothetical protein